MAATEAGTGYGTFLKVGDGGSPSETFADMGAEITSITLPGYTRDAIDASHMSSPDQFREFIAGFMDAGEITLEMAYIPAVEDAFVAAVLAGKQNYQIGNAAWDVVFTVAAICTNYAPSVPMDDKMTASVTLKISGKPSLAAA